MGKSNMPASNKGHANVPHGTRHGASSIAGGATEGKTPHLGGSKPNLPANNVTDKHVPMGTTKYQAGQSPSYLKRGK